MEGDTKIFVSKIPIKYYQSRELYQLLVPEIVEPAIQNITKPENYVRPLKTHRSYVSRRISNCKVKTIGIIRKKYEDGILDQLPGRVKKCLKDQFNSLLEYMKASLNKEEKLFAKELFKSSYPISQLSWQMLRHINVEDFKYRKQSVLWNGINIIINGSKGGSKEFLCNFDIGVTEIQVKSAKKVKKLVDTCVYDINTFTGNHQEHLKDLSIHVPRLNCSNIEPLCMVHKLYKCFCKGKFLGSLPSNFVCNETVAQNMIVEKEKNTNYSTVLNNEGQNEPNSYKGTNEVCKILKNVNDEPSQRIFTSCIVKRKLIQKPNESTVCSLNESEGENVNNYELTNETETSNVGSTSESPTPSRTFSLWLLNEYYYMKHHLSCGEQFILEKPYPNQMVLFPYSELLKKYKSAKNFFLVSTTHPHRVHIAIDSKHEEFNNHIEMHSIYVKDLHRHSNFVNHLIYHRHLENYFVVLQGHPNSWEVKALVSQNTENSSCNETWLPITISDLHNPITFSLSNVKRCIAYSPQTNNLHQNYMINPQAKLTPSAAKIVPDSINAVNICQPYFESNKPNQPEVLSEQNTSLESCFNANEESKRAHCAKDFLNSSSHENETDVFRWFVMPVEKDLTRLHLYKNKQVMFVMYQTIMSAIELAHSSNKNMLLQFSGQQPGQNVTKFGIYIKLSNPKNYITIGPYERGDKYFIQSFNKSNQKVRPMGYWMTTQKCDKLNLKQQEQERGQKISICNDNEINIPSGNYLERNAEEKEDKNQNSLETLPNENSSTNNTKSAKTQLYRIPRYPVITSVGTLLESDIKHISSPENGLYYLIQDQYNQEKHSQDTTNLPTNPQL